MAFCESNTRIIYSRRKEQEEAVDTFAYQATETTCSPIDAAFYDPPKVPKPDYPPPTTFTLPYQPLVTVLFVIYCIKINRS